MARTQYSVKTIKQFEYRGDTAKEFSNRYFFDGSAPADAAAWDALSDAVVAAEKVVYGSNVHIVKVRGYGPTSEVAVNEKSYSQAGTLTVGGTTQAPGDCAAVLRMATTKKSTKNHTVYVFSYFHAARFDPTTGFNDVLFSGQKTNIETYGSAWLAGITVGARTYKRCTPDGHLVTGRICDTYIGHRDFPR